MFSLVSEENIQIRNVRAGGLSTNKHLSIATGAIRKTEVDTKVNFKRVILGGTCKSTRKKTRSQDGIGKEFVVK